MIDRAEPGALSPLGFAGAAQFLTRVPIRTSRAATPSAIVPWFPVVGGLIGLAVAGVAIGLFELLPAFAAAAVAVLVGVAVTGAFHEDGLADTADAIAGGATPERRREILGDSRLGTYGTCAVVGTLLCRTAAVAALLPWGWVATLGVLVAAHALARTAGPVLMSAFAPMSGSDLGASFAASVGRSHVAVAAVAGLAIGAAATGWWVAPFAAIVLVSIAVCGVLARRAFGGVNGDVFGAAEQFAEIGILLVGAALAAR